MSVTLPVRLGLGFQTARTAIPMWTFFGGIFFTTCKIPMPGEAPSTSITAGVSRGFSPPTTQPPKEREEKKKLTGTFTQNQTSMGRKTHPPKQHRGDTET